MDFALQDKVALITGGSRGIGRAIGLCLAAQGVHIVLCGRTEGTLEQTAEEIRALGVKAWPIVADVSRLENIQRFIADGAKAADAVDILVNNAVTSQSAPFDEQTDEDWRYHIDVKLMAYIRCAREVLPHMRARGGGRIANFTKQFANHVANHNITVNCIHPGPTATDRILQSFERQAQDAGVSMEEIATRQIAKIPLGRLITPEDIAAATLFFCSPLANIVTGQSLAIDGGSAEAVTY
jgi:NAD(P)-dependent dehydrogenase (short-subunit alcohol dehydrogenase family)